jgi:hypothetical protein
MERFAAERVAELSDPLIGVMAPLSDERWLVCRPEGQELLVVDRQLQPIWRLRLPSSWRGRHAVTEDLSLVALSLQNEVLLLTGAGREVARFAHPAWGWPAREGCCAFAPDQRYLWATVPTRDDGDELWLVAVEVHWRVLLEQGRWGGDRGPGRLSAPARELGGGQPPAQQAAGDQADQRPGLVPGLQ